MSNPEGLSKRAQLYRDAFEQEAKLKKCCKEYQRKVHATINFFDEVLGKGWHRQADENGDEWNHAISRVTSMLRDYKTPTEDTLEIAELTNWMRSNAPELLTQDKTLSESIIELLDFYVTGPKCGG